MRGYDAVKLTAAYDNPALYQRSLPGAVINTADKIEIRYHEPDLMIAVRLIHVILISRSLWKGAGVMGNRKVSEIGAALVDIREVAVNKELPREERIAEFVRQIKDPYHFKCGRFTVQASFAVGGATLEECIKGILR